MVLDGGVGCAKLAKSRSILANRLSSFKELLISENAPISPFVVAIVPETAGGPVVGILLCTGGISETDVVAMGSGCGAGCGCCCNK